MQEKTVVFKFALDEKVKTPFGDVGSVAMSNHLKTRSGSKNPSFRLFPDCLIVDATGRMSKDSAHPGHCTFMQKPKVKTFAADEIRKLRKFFHLTRADFGDQFLVTDETVKGWESGRRNPCGPALVILGQLDELRAAKRAELERDIAHGRARLG